MSGPDDSLSILRERAWTSLVQRLDALVAADPRMSTARDTLLRPLRLLEILASETGGALAQDVLAAERLRNLLYLASPWSSLVEEAGRLLQDSTAADLSAHEPGAIDLRVLVLIAIAAVRVAPTKELALMFLHTVHGLALSATPAEMLGQMEPYGHQSDSLREVVKLMVLPDAGRLTDNRLFLPRFALDPLSLGRWQCLRTLLTRGIEAALDSVWSTPARQLAAHADSIEAIRPADALPGDELTLSGRFPELTKTKWPKALHVVFASAAAPPIKADVVRFSASAITVRVPAGARPGWIGLADDRLIGEANEARRALRRLLASMRRSIDDGPVATTAAVDVKPPSCLDGAIQSKWIPDLQGLPVPPRTAANRFAGGAAPKDSPVPSANPGSADGPRMSTVVLFRPVVADARGTRANVDELRRASLLLLRGHGRAIRTIELPWIEDSLAVLSSTVRSQDDPRIGGLLDQLSRTALRTPGLEEALWLILVPGPAAFSVLKPTEAAAAVAIATVSELPDLLEQVFVRRERRLERASMDRLRIVGQLLPHHELLVQSSRVETGERVVGAGATRDSGFVAVALDATDRELHRESIKCLSDSRPSHFGLLFPITPEVASVELRDQTQTLYAIRRTDASPLVRAPKRPGETKPRPPELTDDILHWTYHHPRGVRSEISVEVSRDGVWTPFTRLDACRDQQSLPLHRLQRIERMRVVASDGWNATESDIGAHINGRAAAVVARRVNATQWWADVPSGWHVSWEFPGRSLRAAHLIELAADAAGTLTLTATDPDTGDTFTDQRVLEEEESA
jgi:hypothetical protein